MSQVMKYNIHRSNTCKFIEYVKKIFIQKTFTHLLVCLQKVVIPEMKMFSYFLLGVVIIKTRASWSKQADFTSPVKTFYLVVGFNKPLWIHCGINCGWASPVYSVKITLSSWGQYYVIFKKQFWRNSTQPVALAIYLVPLLQCPLCYMESRYDTDILYKPDQFME